MPFIRYAWSVPTERALATLARYAPILELMTSNDL